MKFIIQSDKLVSIRDMISITTFNHMLGKEINFKKRFNCYIETFRKNGHLYVSDYKLIPGERYSYIQTRNKTSYVCISSSETTATLEPESNVLQIVIVKNPLDYHIL